MVSIFLPSFFQHAILESGEHGWNLEDSENRLRTPQNFMHFWMNSDRKKSWERNCPLTFTFLFSGFASGECHGIMNRPIRKKEKEGGAKTWHIPQKSLWAWYATLCSSQPSQLSSWFFQHCQKLPNRQVKGEGDIFSSSCMACCIAASTEGINTITEQFLHNFPFKNNGRAGYGIPWFSLEFFRDRKEETPPP